MRINELKLKNFRCFEEREFIFNSQFNCITGKNASGKTAILDAICFSLDRWSRSYAIVEPYIDFDIPMDEKDIRVINKVDVYEQVNPAYVKIFGYLISCLDKFDVCLDRF
jgi:predicted ATP-dependent endonuclease of OLD family